MDLPSLNLGLVVEMIARNGICDSLGLERQNSAGKEQEGKGSRQPRDHPATPSEKA